VDESGNTSITSLVLWVEKVNEKRRIRMQKCKEIRRNGFISEDEKPKSMESPEAEPSREMRDLFLSCLECGTRWEDTDSSMRQRRIANMKNGGPVSIPLIGQGLQILNH
jgi:hypothetical protein